MSRGYPDWTRPPEYWERGALFKSLEYTDQVGPHVFVARATYTVPTGRAARIEAAGATILQMAAPGVRVLAQGYIDVINGGFDSRIAVATLGPLGGEVRAQETMGSPVSLTAGAVVTIYTQDVNTGGGSNLYEIHCQIVEFASVALPTVNPPVHGLIA